MDLCLSLELRYSHTAHCFRLRAHQQCFSSCTWAFHQKLEILLRSWESKMVLVATGLWNTSGQCTTGDLSLKDLHKVTQPVWWQQCDLGLETHGMLSPLPQQQHSCAWAKKAEKEMCSLTYTWHFSQWQMGSNPESFTFPCTCASSIVGALSFQAQACNSQPFKSAQMLVNWSLGVASWFPNPSQSQFLIKVSYTIHINSVVIQLNKKLKNLLNSCWLDLRPFYQSLSGFSIHLHKKKQTYFPFNALFFFSL